MATEAEPSHDLVARDEVVTLCLAALNEAGASRRVAELLTDAALFAEDRGKSALGVAHLLDHVDAIHDGRLDGRALPGSASPAPPSSPPTRAVASRTRDSTRASPVSWSPRASTA